MGGRTPHPTRDPPHHRRCSSPPTQDHSLPPHDHRPALWPRVSPIFPPSFFLFAWAIPRPVLLRCEPVPPRTRTVRQLANVGFNLPRSNITSYTHLTFPTFFLLYDSHLASLDHGTYTEKSLVHARRVFVHARWSSSTVPYCAHQPSFTSA